MFYDVECPKCGYKYWAIYEKSKCPECGLDDVIGEMRKSSGNPNRTSLSKHKLRENSKERR